MLPSGEPPATNIPPIPTTTRETTLPPDETRLGPTGEGGIRIPIRGLLPAAREAAGMPTPLEPTPRPTPSKAMGQAAVKAAGRARTPNAPMLKSIGLTLRGEFPAGYYDFQDLQTGGSIALKKEGFTEQALRDKVTAHREAMRNTPPEGKSDLAAEKAKNAQARAEATEKMPPVQQSVPEHELVDAEGLLKQEVGMMLSGDRPGRYFDESTQEEHALVEKPKEGIRHGGTWRTVKSIRPQMPFMREHPEISPSAAQTAIEKDGTNPLYQKMMRAALDFIKKGNKKATDEGVPF